MDMSKLSPAIQDVVNTIMSMQAAGYGRILVEINPHQIRIEPTGRRLYKIGLDKNRNT